MIRKLVPTAVAAALVAGGAWWYSGSDTSPRAANDIPQTTAANASAGYGAAEAQAAAEDIDVSRVREMTLGDPDAPVEVIEYASFTCPHCANFHMGPFKELKENYIDTGKVHFINREVYFDRYGLWAGLVARCGDSEQRYFGMLDLIYAEQRDWAGSNDPAVVADNLREIGRRAGLSGSEIDACFADAEMAQALVSVYQQNAAEHDVNATPTFIINGRKHANMSYADFARTLDGLLSN